MKPCVIHVGDWGAESKECQPAVNVAASTQWGENSGELAELTMLLPEILQQLQRRTGFLLMNHQAA